MRELYILVCLVLRVCSLSFSATVWSMIGYRVDLGLFG